jgi:hypothetical protein
MTNTIKVKPNQSMLDVIVQGSGSLESGMQMMTDNSCSISEYPDVDDVFVIMDAVSKSGDQSAARYFNQSNIVIGTLGNVGVVGFTIVLKPEMKVVPNTVSPPSVTGYYSFDFSGTPGYINVNPLAGTYLTTNPISYMTEERYGVGEVPDVVSEYSISLPSAKSIPYQVPWLPYRGFMMVWSGSDIYNTATFVDSEGNQAYVSPLILLDNLTQNVEEYLLANIYVELISANHGRATLRLTRSHGPVGHINFVDHQMSWIEDAAGGMPDPTDPGNPDKTILILPRGRYTFGVATIYRNGAIIYPPSSFTEVVVIE